MTRLPIKEELRQMRDEMNQMIDEVFNTARNMSNQTSIDKPTSYRRPVTEVNEKANEYHVTAELPGADKEHIDVTAENNTVTISVNHEDTQETNEATRKTRQSFYRRFTVPNDAHVNEATASYSNGVLELRIPKKANSESTTIEIQ